MQQLARLERITDGRVRHSSVQAHLDCYIQPTRLHFYKPPQVIANSRLRKIRAWPQREGLTMDDRAAPAAQKYPDPDQDEEEVGPRGERPQQTAAAGEASGSAGTDLAPGHDDASVAPSAASTQPQPDTTTTTPTHADAKEGHESDHHDPSRHHHLSSTTHHAAPAVAPGATTAGSPADVPIAAAAPPPHFVAPSSYLRPLSRDPFARSPSASGPTPSPSGQQKKVQMVTPIDREQIEGLVSLCHPLQAMG